MSIPYIPSDQLLKASEVALFLKRPLLLSGEPGTGKTRYAYYFAGKNNMDLFVFNTKSASLAKDLFYIYDAIGHFAEKEKSIVEYLSLGPVGKAIVSMYGVEKIKDLFLNSPSGNAQLLKLRSMKDRDQIIASFLNGIRESNCVVLIDEVDKAPRDFPNDILNEIESLQFGIHELGLEISLDIDKVVLEKKLFIILTSNFEKNLPDAFLRRCVYHHIEFPDKVDDLAKIVMAHVPGVNKEILEQRIDEFLSIRRNDAIRKKPATSELIDCIKWLLHLGKIETKIVEDEGALSSIIKKKEDLRYFLNRTGNK